MSKFHKIQFYTKNTTDLQTRYTQGIGYNMSILEQYTDKFICEETHDDLKYMITTVWKANTCSENAERFKMDLGMRLAKRVKVKACIETQRPGWIWLFFSDADRGRVY